MDAEDLLTSLEMELEKDNFDSRKTRGLLQTYLTAKYRFDVEEYILMGVSKGAPTFLFNKFKEEDSIFSKRISFRIFDLWFSKLKREIESGKSNSVNYFNFVHNRNLQEIDKVMDVAVATTKNRIKQSDGLKVKVEPKDVEFDNNYSTKQESSVIKTNESFTSYDPLEILSTQKEKPDAIWDKIPRPKLPLHFLDVKGMEEHPLFNDNSWCYKYYVEHIDKEENKGILIDQDGYLFDPFTARPGSKFYIPEDRFNMKDPLPIPITMKEPTLIVEAINYKYIKPNCINNPAMVTMHSMDLSDYLTHDLRLTILKNNTDQIFYKIEK